jgi:hypothetical protein
MLMRLFPHSRASRKSFSFPIGRSNAAAVAVSRNALAITFIGETQLLGSASYFDYFLCFWPIPQMTAFTLTATARRLFECVSLSTLFLL